MWHRSKGELKMDCLKCNHILPDDSEFCQYCGEKVEKETENITEQIQPNCEIDMQMAVNSRNRYCSKCGKLIDNETKTCTGCGKKYFKGIKLNKFSITVIALSLGLAVSVIINIVQLMKIYELKELVDFWVY